MKEIYKKYSGLMFRIVLTVIIWSTWSNLSQVRTKCYFPLIRYSDLSPEDIACKTVRDQEVIWRSFFSDSYPLVVFLGVVFIALWFRKK